MSMMHTLDVVRQLDRAFAAALTFVPPQGQETGDAIQAVAELGARSEEHKSEPQSLMRISYAVFCLKKTNYKINKYTIANAEHYILRLHSQPIHPVLLTL